MAAGWDVLVRARRFQTSRIGAFVGPAYYCILFQLRQF